MPRLLLTVWRQPPIAIIELWVETEVVGDNAIISSCCSSLSSNDPSLTTKHYMEGTYELWCECHGGVIAGPTARPSKKLRAQSHPANLQLYHHNQHSL